MPVADLINTLFIIVILASLALFLVLFLKSRQMRPEFKKDQDASKYTIPSLVEHIKESLDAITRANLLELGLNEVEYKKQANKRLVLKKALKNCMHGSIEDKQFVKAFIYDILSAYIPRDRLGSAIPFDNPFLLSVKEKFFILLHEYKKRYGQDALAVLIESNGLDLEKKLSDDDSPCYIITAREIEELYERESPVLSHEDKLEIITQAVYEKYKGLGVIDEIRDMNIDGVSGGVSGVTDADFYGPSSGWPSREPAQKVPRSYESIWIFFRGKTIKLDFLSFESEKELRRVCQNIYRYNRGGQLSEATGYRVNEMKDGSRVLVVRPPFSESWALFVRKFHIRDVTLEGLITDKGAELPVSLIKYLVKGCMITAITGQQGSGKTTLLMAMVRHIYPTLTLRVQEMAFELHLRKLYPERNILTFRETENISGQEGLDIQKKTDGSVNILGEVATDPVAAWMVQMAQVASLFTLFTHHAKTTRDLVYSLRNSLLKCEMFNNEKIAEQQVVSVLDFDIHLARDFRGKRYIERITEIIELPAQKPYPQAFREAKTMAQKQTDFMETTAEFYARMTDRPSFETRNIIEFQDGEYRIVNPISREKVRRMLQAMSQEDGEAFSGFLEKNRGLVG
ncbi:MAG TPA: ATPase, T2SS/T4P/T4SS family [Thermoclostridium caenicola]|uniref:ATPase, T2SS/T4P/T4SS family n=1 Tax=Thermoclostridium caenicola TaxID=659425 RepID=UPI002C93133A|nr:ATPase, T2SS/T4P/T4SS family [Thermoclostridium caenicola]HOL84023.1 ATPase, T2SS/T4P/T4SS family [Thermoclostridium caenicola]HPO75605.1 ATPase, T2SS/T4P/T4SS family [Thermoclostridium caenicola]